MTNLKKYNTKRMKETCLNCGKKSCALAGVGNRARINENNGCWTADLKKEIQEIISKYPHKSQYREEEGNSFLSLFEQALSTQKQEFEKILGEVWKDFNHISSDPKAITYDFVLKVKQKLGEMK